MSSSDDWTSRESFSETTLSEPTNCAGCARSMPTGLTVLGFERALKPGRKKLTVVKVHDEECWATWNHDYWTMKADRRDALLRSPKWKERSGAANGYPVKGGVRQW